ncbi:MAG: PAS domain S-box protein [Bacteroidia bacterium]|nr:PAS domain S-box protein [Bacteroidia bacterium]
MHKGIKWNLQFDKNMEQEFQKNYIEKSYNVVRIGLLLGVLLYSAFGILDIWILPYTKTTAWIIRFAVVAPVIIFTIISSYFGFFKKYHQLLLMVMGIVAGVGIIVMSACSKENELGYKYYYFGLILVIMWVHTFIRLRFIYSTICCLAITLLFEIVAIFVQNMLAGGMNGPYLPSFINYNFFILSANVIGMFASYHMESLNRKDFLQQKKTEKENEENKRKNVDIFKQKEEIIRKNNELEHQKEEINAQAEQLAHANKELEQLSIVAKKTDNAILIADINGHIEWVNEGFVRLYGYNLDQLFLFKGNNILNISKSELLKDVIQNGFKGRDAIIYETLTLTKFGDKIWIQTTLTPVLNEKKEVVKLVAIDSNIHDMKLAEAEILNQKEEIIQKSEELKKQNEIVEHSIQNMEILNHIGQSILSSFVAEKIADTVYHSINSMMDAAIFVIAVYNEEKNRLDVISSKEKEETLPFFSWDMNDDCRLAVWCFKNNKEVLINNYPDDALQYIKEIHPPIIGEISTSVIYYPLCVKAKKIGVIGVQSFKKNAYNEYHLNIIKNLALYVSIALDNANAYQQIIEQKEHIEKANAELEKLSIVASKTDNAVFVADPKGNIEWVNEGFTRIYGYNLNQLNIFLGNNLLNISSSPVLKDVIQNGFKDGDAIIYENLITTKFGEKIWVQTTLTPILDRNKNVIKLVAIDSNIHKRKLAEEEILRQKDELETQRDFVMRQGDKIASQNVKIKQQRDLVVKQKKEITDSIQYAKRIQTAILPQREQLEFIFKDYFVLFKPKDIVSGDFYWVHEMANLVFFAAVDCTGHGVPGAFMSMLGISYLNEIVIEKGITKPDEILLRLRSVVINTLHQTGQVGENKDGMDIALCVLDKKKMQVQYAGANNPLYIIRKTSKLHPFKDGQSHHVHVGGKDGAYILTEIKGDKMPIGVHIKDTLPYTNHTLQLQNNDALYIFSDGYVDQFGGEIHKKFLSKRFRDFLMMIQPLSLPEQKELLTKEFEDWKGSLEQIDDVLVMGVKV